MDSDILKLHDAAVAHSFASQPTQRLPRPVIDAELQVKITRLQTRLRLLRDLERLNRFLADPPSAHDAEKAAIVQHAQDAGYAYYSVMLLDGDKPCEQVGLFLLQE